MGAARPEGKGAREAASLHAAGLRVTGPRLAILELLRQDRTHPTAEQVYRRLRPSYPGLSLATVYNALEAFTRRGLCRRVPSDGTSQRFDGTLAPHHHAHCSSCGQLFDLPPEVFSLPAPPEHLPAVGQVRGVHVTLEITCERCRAELG